MVGDAEITALLDGTHTFPIPTPFQAPADGEDVGPRRLLEEVHPGEAVARLAEERLGLPFEGSINAFLVNLDGRLTLIDTGSGGSRLSQSPLLPERSRGDFDDALMPPRYAGVRAGSSDAVRRTSVKTAFGGWYTTLEQAKSSRWLAWCAMRWLWQTPRI